jgi:hypothetical protein
LKEVSLIKDEKSCFLFSEQIRIKLSAQFLRFEDYFIIDSMKFMMFIFRKNIKQQISDCVLLGDRGYLSEAIQLDLFQTVYIKLETPKRTNQKEYKPQPYIFRRTRKRIKTLFSKLCDQFLIRRNYAKVL